MEKREGKRNLDLGHGTYKDRYLKSIIDFGISAYIPSLTEVYWNIMDLVK